MATEVIMPQMGESIFEGTITKWLKKVGDSVAKDEPLFEISTDKVDAEIPAPAGGVLTEIKVGEGATVQINTVVATLGEEGEAMAALAPTAPVTHTSAGDGAAKNAPEVVVPSVTGGTDVVMPQMGESIFEGTITKWLKKVGDSVQKDEPLFEISTDKVDAEIPAPAAGVLSRIVVPEGSTVQINTVVGVIGGVAGAATPAATALPVASAAVAAPVAEVEPEATAGTTAKLRSSPLVRKIARDNHLDLRRIPGTGNGGRITKEDALKFLAEKGAGTAAAVSAPAPVAALVAARPSVVAAAAPVAVPASVPVAAAAPVSAPAAPGELVPLTKMRSIIAQRMVESVQVSPHVHTVFKVDMTRIVRLREKEKGKYEQRNGVKLTYMPFIAAAAVETLRKFPIVNASMEGVAPNLGVRYHQNVNLGIAVALEWGLIVPVIKQAEERSFLGLARAVADLAERARPKRLKPEEVSGSTFTLTNSGIFGEEFGTPIINQPDSAILAIGGLKKEPVVLTDADGNDTIAIRSTQNFCLGFDHRIIDGADAGKFMAEFKKTLENWSGEIG